MKKIISALAATVGALCMPVTGGGIFTVKADESLPTKAVYLCDFESGMPVVAENEEKRLPIASMCKIMTLLLTFESVDRGELSYDDEITVSENASGMGGSQVFLDTGLTYRAEDLMRTVAVCSANDSCVALAERVSGSESAFVDRMNARAKELGAENTLFANCTGLPKEPQYSCAKDVSLMFRQLLTHQKYFEFSRVWLEDFKHPDGRTTTITNTNKLIRAYKGCDGGKTGYTSEAGSCLAATAKRGETRLISVVIGADNSKNRNKKVSQLFDFGFANYEKKYCLIAGQSTGKIAVKGGKKDEIELFAKNNLSVFTKKGDNSDLKVEYRYCDECRAPFEKGTMFGEAILYRDGVEIARTELITGESVERFSWWDAMREGARNWN